MRNRFCALVFSVLVVFVGLISCYAQQTSKNQIFAANRNAGKYVALTFDDGPHSEYTEQILDILKKHNAKATFFVIGKNAKKYPELVKRESLEGHEIGNHTFTHPSMKKITDKQLQEEIEMAQNTIYDITGEKPVIFRSPGGIYDDRILKMSQNYGCRPVLWSWRQDTKDWSAPTVEYVVNTVVNNLRDGDIILFHDYNAKSSPTPEALEIILPKLIEKGYSFVTVSELMDMEAEV